MSQGDKMKKITNVNGYYDTDMDDMDGVDWMNMIDGVEL